MSDIINEAAQLIQVFEGFKSNPYQDSANIWTVGIGFTIWNHKPVSQHYPNTITQSQAEAYLSTLVTDFNTRLLKLIEVPLTDNQNVALISFCYNVGINAFENSTMLKYINSSDFTSAANEFPKWNMSGGQVVQGLVNRRAIEEKIFTT